MRPATDPSIDYKLIVQRGYDQCAGAYHLARGGEACSELEPLIRQLKDGADVLDIGCGAGVPISRALSRRFAVTGVDISSEMVQKATVNVPAGSFIHADIMSIGFSPACFDAAVAFYSIFHLPRREHPDLFRRIHGWLRPGGYLLATLTLSAEEPYLEDDFFGVPMYWSNHSLEDYRRILAATGFAVLGVTAVGHGYTETHPASVERHPLVLARKAEASTRAGRRRVQVAHADSEESAERWEPAGDPRGRAGIAENSEHHAGAAWAPAPDRRRNVETANG